jgi:plasmid replication initiation protein
MVANQLYGMGFRDLSAASLKPKHVEALVAQWKGEELSAGTIKNRMSELRWWSEKIQERPPGAVLVPNVPFSGGQLRH